MLNGAYMIVREMNGGYKRFVGRNLNAESAAA